MECTQRLDFEPSQADLAERVCPEQIGFLGILGTKYPVIKGPNKVGRDPQTCSIVLNKNSISRQHAVINVLSGNNYMLMDLDSANKTRLNNKALQAYIPVPMSNGDTVQFGEVFGIFRLLEEETDLPCTQAIDIPDTPVPIKHASRLKHAVIPESPDVSDKDDSFLVPSQPKAHNHFKSPSNKYISPASKTIPMQSVGSKKIENIFWNSSKKTDSFNLDDSRISLDESNPNGKIHEVETQAPNNESRDSIFTAETQMPPENSSPSIHSLNTQLPVPEHLPAVCKIDNPHEMEIDLFAANKENDHSIFNADTQLVIADKEIISKSKTLESNIFETNTQFPDDLTDDDGLVNRSNHIWQANTELPESLENENSIFDANTQMTLEKPVEPQTNDNGIFNADTQLPSNKRNVALRDSDDIFIADTQPPTEDFNVSIDLKSTTSKDSIDKSNDIIVFKEIDTQDLLDDFQSQPILGPELLHQENEDDIPLSQSDTITDEHIELKQDDNSENTQTVLRPTKRNARIESDESTDCEDINIRPTQKILPKAVNDDELTDCDDSDPEVKKVIVPVHSNDPDFDIEDLATQVIPEAIPNNPECCASNNKNEVPASELCFEDMPTQVIPGDNLEKEPDFEDLPTQVIPEDINCKTTVTENTQYSEEMISPFKVPFQTPIKVKRRDIPKVNESKFLKPPSPLAKPVVDNADDEMYYGATQEILEDLCSQKETADSKTGNNNVLRDKALLEQTDDEVVPCSVEDYKVGEKFPHLDEEVNTLVRDKSSGSSDGEEKVAKFVSCLSTKEIGDVIGVEFAKPKRVPSYPSDLETTPKKVRPFKFMETELPDSQEIKTSVSLSSRLIATESSSDSETEKESQEQTLVFHKKKRAKAMVKKDLWPKLDVQALPTRIIHRTRKPTLKMQECDETAKKRIESVLQPKYLTENDDYVDTDIITENITRLRNKTEKKNRAKVDEKTKNDKSKSVEENSEASKSKFIKKDRNDKFQVNDATVDLTNLDDDLRVTREINEKSINSDVSSNKFKSKRTNEKSKEKSESVKHDESKEQPKEKVADAKVSNHKPRETRKTERSKKKETQEKITSYIVSKDEESKASISISRVDGSLNSTNDTSSSTRSTRSRNRDQDKKAVSPDHDTTKRKRGRPRKEDQDKKQKDKPAEKDNRKRTTVDKQEPEEQSIRRSKRQKTKDEEKVDLKHEQSIVYSVSSESGTDSPKVLKRAATLHVDVPSPKRTRSATGSVAVPSVSSAGPSCSSSRVRSTPSRGPRTHYVLFTAFPCEEVKGKLEKLGAVVVSDVVSCSVVLTLQLRRTFKLLCAVGLGRPIVGPAWVQACVDRGAIVVMHLLPSDPWPYLLVDSASEARFRFSLRRTLAGPRRYLAGRRVSATPSVLPSAPEMKLIVECSGGTWQAGGGGGAGAGAGAGGGAGAGAGAGGPAWLAVSCAADRALWPGLRARGATVVSSELILTGVLRQELDIKGYTLK